MTTWIPGSPTGRGSYWIVSVFEGTQLVNLVTICPAYIYRGDPNAPLQIQWAGGLANRFADFAPTITHHMRVVPPEPPKSIDELIAASSIGDGLRDIEERGIDAHLKTLDEEMRPKRRRSKR